MHDLAPVGDNSDIRGDVVTDKLGRRFVEVPTNSAAQAQVVAARRRIADLPDVPKRTNAISVVLAYELFGLSTSDIAIATMLSEQQVGNIMMLDAYRDMRTAVIDSIKEREIDSIRAVFLAKANRSAQRIVELADSARPDVALAASKEVLDRSGNTVKQIIEHQHKLEGGLTIEYIKRDNSPHVPTFSIDGEAIDAEQIELPSAVDGDVRSEPGSSAVQAAQDHTRSRKGVRRTRPTKRKAQAGNGRTTDEQG